MADKIILPDDPEAAVPETIHGWRSRRGIFFDNEASARYDGCTHRLCEGCGKPAEKWSTVCDKCRAKRNRAKWLAMPKKKWDGNMPICIMGTEDYFFYEEQLEEYCEEHGVNASDLLLVYCTPAKHHTLDAVDFLEDSLPEDDPELHIPKAVMDAENAFNDAVKAMGVQVWYEGNVAVEIGSEEKEGETR